MPTITYYPTSQTIRQGVLNKTTYNGEEKYTNIVWDATTRRIDSVVFEYEWADLPSWADGLFNSHSIYFFDTSGNQLAQPGFSTVYSKMSHSASNTTSQDLFNYIVDCIENKGSITIVHKELNPTIYTSGSNKISQCYFSFTSIKMTITYTYINTLTRYNGSGWQKNLIYYCDNNKWVWCKPYYAVSCEPQIINITSDMATSITKYDASNYFMRFPSISNICDTSTVCFTTTQNTSRYLQYIDYYYKPASSTSASIRHLRQPLSTVGEQSFSIVSPTTGTDLEWIRLVLCVNNNYIEADPQELFELSEISIHIDNSPKWQEVC